MCDASRARDHSRPGLLSTRVDGRERARYQRAYRTEPPEVDPSKAGSALAGRAAAIPARGRQRVTQAVSPGVMRRST